MIRFNRLTKKWEARIEANNGMKFFLGSFKTEQEAAEALHGAKVAFGHD